MTRILFQRASSGFRTVQGEVIRKIQLLLDDPDVGTIDGIYGDKTERGLRRFQLRQELSQTGKVDEDTWRHLVAPQTDLRPFETGAFK